MLQQLQLPPLARRRDHRGALPNWVTFLAVYQSKMIPALLLPCPPGAAAVAASQAASSQPPAAAAKAQAAVTPAAAAPTAATPAAAKVNLLPAVDTCDAIQ